MPTGIYKHKSGRKFAYKPRLSRRGIPTWNKGKSSWSKGKRFSEEHKKKISTALMGRIISEETKEKLSKALRGKKYSEKRRVKAFECMPRGENHYNWKGGVTPISSAIRNSFEYKLWREAVFERDDWTCIWCGRRSQEGDRVSLQADHIKPFSLYPELRFAIDNGRTLCRECHKTTDTFAGNITKYERNT